MKSEGFNAHSKYMILKHVLKENNVSHTCKLFGISRTTFYNWYRSYQKYGFSGLKNKEPKKPQMPNKVNKAIEGKILAYVEKYPSDGPKRIYYELKSENLNIGESGIYNVLRRNSLTRKAQRITYSKDKALQSMLKQNKIEKLGPYDNYQDADYPGHYVIQRIDFIGKFDGIGKIYQYSFYDVHSQFGVVKLYNKKQDIDIWHFFQLKIVYLLKTFNLKIDYLITKKTKEFLPFFVKGNKEGEITEHLNIKHSFVEDAESPLFDTINGFNEFLVKEFYSKIPMDKGIDSFHKLERAFQKFLRYYNFSRVISSGSNAGKVPAEIILERAAQNNVDFDTLPLWLFALLNQPRGGNSNE